jgi:hypothetical protein
MTNYKKLFSTPQKTAKYFYNLDDCVNCPITGSETCTASELDCKDTLENWLNEKYKEVSNE